MPTPVTQLISPWLSARASTTNTLLVSSEGMARFPELEKRSTILSMRASLETMSTMDLEDSSTLMETTTLETGLTGSAQAKVSSLIRAEGSTKASGSSASTWAND